MMTVTKDNDNDDDDRDGGGDESVHRLVGHPSPVMAQGRQLSTPPVQVGDAPDSSLGL